MKIWIAVFWAPGRASRRARTRPDPPGRRLGGPLLMVAADRRPRRADRRARVWPPDRCYDLSQRAAADLLDPAAYVRTVLG